MDATTARSLDASREPRWVGAAAGVLTGLSGLAASIAATSVLNQRVNPVQAVAEAVVEKTPGQLAEKLIHLVGRLDKPLLLTGVVAVLLAFSACAGALVRRRPWFATAVFVGMGALAGWAAATRPGATGSALVPVGVGVLTWLLVIGFLRPRPTTDRDQPRVPFEEPSADRRQFLVRAAGVGAASVAVAAGGRFLGRGRRAVESARSRLRLPTTPGVVPAGADLRLKGLTPWRVPNQDFYRIDTALVIPTVTPEDWHLRIHGMVDHPMTLTYADLLDRALTEAWVTICCVSNEVGGDLIGNAWWSGVRIAPLLAEAGVSPDADAVKQTSKDGWTCGTPIGALTDDRNALLALAMNGEPLPLEHGFPVRMVVPGLFGFVSATKWLVDLEVTRFADFEAYWTERGWSAHGPVRTQSRIEVPHTGRAMAGDVRVAGTAWAQHTGVAQVEVRLDGGPWAPCHLAAAPNTDTWVQWSTTVKAAPGLHTLTVRATDDSGYTQTGERRDVVPDGATGWHSIHFTADG